MKDTAWSENVLHDLIEMDTFGVVAKAGPDSLGGEPGDAFDYSALSALVAETMASSQLLSATRMRDYLMYKRVALHALAPHHA